MATVRVHHNIWGNYVCFIGNRAVEKYSDQTDMDAKVWLATQMIFGHTVSPKSHFSAAEAEPYKKYVDLTKMFDSGEDEVIKL